MSAEAQKVIAELMTSNPVTDTLGFEFRKGPRQSSQTREPTPSIGEEDYALSEGDSDEEGQGSDTTPKQTKEKGKQTVVIDQGNLGEPSERHYYENLEREEDLEVSQTMAQYEKWYKQFYPNVPLPQGVN